MSERKRKTKNPCGGCGLHLERCICAAIPRLDLRTRVALVVHAKELKRTSNSGALALRALVNQEMCVRGLGLLDLSSLLRPEYHSVLFYPADGAVELTREFVASVDRPIQLIVPDGNWRQASKVAIRHPELAHLTRVKISAPNTARFHLRREHSPEGMSTLEAIARAIGVIEGEEAGAALLRLYQAKLRATMEGRGISLEA
jgi:DTW domain-containing protein YfiP